MDTIIALFQNRPLIVAAISWFTTGVLKVVIELIINKELNFTRIFGAGGMPSSHTATVVSLAFAVAYYNGVDSSVFAISVILAVIVIHDAMGVRRETGIQAKVLNKIVFDFDIFGDINLEKKLKEYIGHTPSQVFIGGVVGFLVFILMVNVLK